MKGNEGQRKIKKKKIEVRKVKTRVIQQKMKNGRASQALKINVFFCDLVLKFDLIQKYILLLMSKM